MLNFFERWSINLETNKYTDCVLGLPVIMCAFCIAKKKEGKKERLHGVREEQKQVVLLRDTEN